MQNFLHFTVEGFALLIRNAVAAALNSSSTRSFSYP